MKHILLKRLVVFSEKRNDLFHSKNSTAKSKLNQHSQAHTTEKIELHWPGSKPAFSMVIQHENQNKSVSEKSPSTLIPVHGIQVNFKQSMGFLELIAVLEVY